MTDGGFPVPDERILDDVRELLASASWKSGPHVSPADVGLEVERKGVLRRPSDGSIVVYCAVVGSRDERIPRSTKLWSTLYYDPRGERLALD